MAGKRGKGLLAAASKDKDKKRPISRSARPGLQVYPSMQLFVVYDISLMSYIII